VLQRLLLLVLLLVWLPGCGTLAGNTSPRELTAATTSLILTSPPLAVSYVLSLYVNAVAYLTAWIAGDQAGDDVPIWLSVAYGPWYATSNTPWCWLYAGAEPEKRKNYAMIPAGAHIRQIELSSTDPEYPPTLTWCRTGVDQVNLKGDESFPIVRDE
jgi:hypothetical protein